MMLLINYRLLFFYSFLSGPPDIFHFKRNKLLVMKAAKSNSQLHITQIVPNLVDKTIYRNFHYYVRKILDSKYMDQTIDKQMKNKTKKNKKENHFQIESIIVQSVVFIYPCVHTLILYLIALNFSFYFAIIPLIKCETFHSAIDPFLCLYLLWSLGNVSLGLPILLIISI